jgi:hypothetical protein
VTPVPAPGPTRSAAARRVLASKRRTFVIRGLALTVFLAGSLAAAASGVLGEKDQRTVQVVYESDTRGYYLPCG